MTNMTSYNISHHPTITILYGKRERSQAKATDRWRYEDISLFSWTDLPKEKLCYFYFSPSGLTVFSGGLCESGGVGSIVMGVCV